MIAPSSASEARVSERRGPETRITLGIVYPFSNLATVPSLMNAAALLAANGFDVHIFTNNDPDYPTPHFQSDRVTIHNSPLSAAQRRLNTVRNKTIATAAAEPGARSASINPVRWLSRRAGRTLQRVVNVLALRHDLATIKRLNRQTPFAAFIGLDPQGLDVAGIYALKTGTRLVYWSLELLLSRELITKEHFRLKQREAQLLDVAESVIVQDPARAALLVSDTGVSPQKIVLIPNAPLGPTRTKRSRYWHRRFGLSEETRVVLHAGSLDPWTGIEGLVRAAASWPEPWVFVVHSRMSSHHLDLGLRRIAQNGKVYFSDTPVGDREFDELVDSADVGIAFYLTSPGSPGTQENIRTIGLSSGKIAYYLRSGLPVIVNTGISAAQFVEQHACGLSVDSPELTGQALTKIHRSYDDMSRHAHDTFSAHCDFAKAFAPFAARLSMPRQPRS